MASSLELRDSKVLWADDAVTTFVLTSSASQGNWLMPGAGSVPGKSTTGNTFAVAANGDSGVMANTPAMWHSFDLNGANYCQYVWTCIPVDVGVMTTVTANANLGMMIGAVGVPYIGMKLKDDPTNYQPYGPKVGITDGSNSQGWGRFNAFGLHYYTTSGNVASGPTLGYGLAPSVPMIKGALFNYGSVSNPTFAANQMTGGHGWICTRPVNTLHNEAATAVPITYPPTIDGVERVWFTACITWVFATSPSNFRANMELRVNLYSSVSVPSTRNYISQTGRGRTQYNDPDLGGLVRF